MLIVYPGGEDPLPSDGTDFLYRCLTVLFGLFVVAPAVVCFLW